MQRLRGLKDTWVIGCGQQLWNNLNSRKKLIGPERTISSRVDGKVEFESL
jgi:hypothetical protein